jgi:hypothetical protein
MSSLPGHHYSDAFRVKLESEDRPNAGSLVGAFFVSLQPWRFEIPELGEVASLTIEPGTALGDWEIHDVTSSEVIVGLDRSFIDLRISLFVENVDDQFYLTATTVARYDDWQGRLYLAPVQFGHQIVLADAMRRMAVILR